MNKKRGGGLGKMGGVRLRKFEQPYVGKLGLRMRFQISFDNIKTAFFAVSVKRDECRA